MKVYVSIREPVVYAQGARSTLSNTYICLPRVINIYRTAWVEICGFAAGAILAAHGLDVPCVCLAEDGRGQKRTKGERSRVFAKRR